MKMSAIGLIRLYQKLISPLSKLIWPGGACCFSPTCSQYAIEAIKKKGVVKGINLSISRIVRCYPFSKGGFDPVV